MTKLIYFNDNELVKAFCGSDSKLISKKFFSDFPEVFVNSIAVCYGLSNYGEIQVCRRANINFIYIDNGYFGTMNSYLTKEKVRKNFYRIVFNATTLTDIIKRNDDRLNEQLNFLKTNYGVYNYINNLRPMGSKLLLIPPTGKVLKICKLLEGQWEEETIKILTKITNLKPVVRARPKSREERFVKNPIHIDMEDAYGVVTFNSNVSTEALLFGIPSFIFGEFSEENLIRNAAISVSKSIYDINQYILPENRYEYLSHLAYGQFSREEVANGFAKNFLLNNIMR